MKWVCQPPRGSDAVKIKLFEIFEICFLCFVNISNCSISYFVTLFSCCLTYCLLCCSSWKNDATYNVLFIQNFCGWLIHWMFPLSHTTALSFVLHTCAPKVLLVNNNMPKSGLSRYWAAPCLWSFFYSGAKFQWVHLLLILSHSGIFFLLLSSAHF